MKPLPIVLAVFAVVVLVAVAWLLHEPAPEMEADGVVVESGAVAAPADEQRPTLAVAPVATPRASLDGAVAPAPTPPVVVVASMPDSYRQALGGIVGRVVEESGEPVPHLPIELLGGGVAEVLPPLDAILHGGRSEMQVELGATETDATGRFAFREIEPRILGLLVLDAGGPRAMLKLLEQTPVSGVERDLGDIVLPGSVTFVGLVVDERHEPVSGARVRATDLQPIILASGITEWRPGSALLIDTDEGGRELQLVIEPPAAIARLERLLPFPTTHTDADGRFELPGVRPGLASLVVDTPSRPAVVEGPVPTGEAGSVRDVGTLVMVDGLTLRGRVVDDQGKPVPHAEVRAGSQMPVAPVTLLRPPLLADAEGRFEVTGLREGGARAVARAEAHHEFTPDDGGAAAGGETVVRLPGRRTLTLALLDPDGLPVEQARVFARRLPVEGAEELPDFIVAPTARGEEQGLTRDEQGRFLVGDLDPGLWDVLVSVDGYGPVRERHDLSLADATTQVTLAPSVGMTVRVTRASDGEPVEWARVSARNLDRTNDGPPQPVTAARTDATGRAVLSDLDEARFAIEVAHPAFAVALIETELPLPEEPGAEPGVAAELSVALSRGGAITGTVLENGVAPTRLLMVTLTRDDDIKSSAVMPRMTLTDLEGRFRFDDIDPGSVGVEVRERVDLGSLTSWWEPFAMTALAAETLFVAEDAELETVLVVGNTWADVPTGFVEGRLLVNGHPGAGWKVRTWGRIRRSVGTGPDGRFTLGQIAAGDVTLTLGAPGRSMSDGAVDAYRFELLEGDRHFAPIEVTTGSLSGRVWSRIDGRPVEGAQVAVQPLEDQGDTGWFGSRSAVGATDAEGRFHFDTVGAGRYAVRAEAQGFAAARSDPVEVSGLRPTTGVELRLSAPVTVRGTVQFEGLDEEPTWAWLNATTPEGDRAGARVDVDTGTYVFDDLMPDRNWSVGCYTNTDAELQPVELSVSRDREDVVLVFRPAEPPAETDEVTEESAAETSDGDPPESDADGG